jgi:hypothetical protein
LDEVAENEIKVGVGEKDMADKNKVGRPLKFKSAEEIQQKIDAYFKSCLRPLMDKSGEQVLDGNGEPITIQYRPYTIGGLAFALGMTRQTLLNYQRNDEFFDTITRAKQQCEIYAEESLFSRDSVQGAKFTLINNYDNWRDKQEVEHSGETGVRIINDIPRNKT